MVIAELEHNPYTRETEVRFNGRAPRINSQIEKYDGKPLKDWVDRIPEIFYNEMNGYDFELRFSGRESDYEEICHAFLNKDVHVVHMRGLEDAENKSLKIDALLTWLRNHPNRRFDYDAFWKLHRDFFESAYPYIIIGGVAPGCLNKDVEVELVESMDELDSIVLTSTPLLFVVDRQNYGQFRKDLITVLGRPDVRHDQLFFLIHDSLNEARETRVISDMGIRDPQIVNRADDTRAVKYLLNYPMTEYITEAIRIFRTLYSETSDILKREYENSGQANKTTHTAIEILESDLTALKQGNDYFSMTVNYIASHALNECLSGLKQKLAQWKNRKTRASSYGEAQIAAEDYASYIESNMQSYVGYINRAALQMMRDIEEELRSRYTNIGIDAGFVPENIVFVSNLTCKVPNLQRMLLGWQTVDHNKAKGDFLGVLHFPGTGQSGGQAVWYYDQWRSNA